MKRNDITKLHQLTVAELQAQADQLDLDITQAKLARSVGKLKDTSSINRLRKDLARVRTILTQKKLVEKAAAQAAAAKPAKKATQETAEKTK